MGKLGSSAERRVLARMVKKLGAILDYLPCRWVVLNAGQRTTMNAGAYAVMPRSSLMAAVPVMQQVRPRDELVPGQTEPVHWWL